SDCTKQTRLGAWRLEGHPGCSQLRLAFKPPSPKPPSLSYSLSVTIGSTRAARIAGSAAAKNARTPGTASAGTAANVSVPVTFGSHREMSFAEMMAVGTPQASPATTDVIA